MNTITLILIAIGLIIVVSVATCLCYVGFNILKSNREILNVDKVKED